MSRMLSFSVLAVLCLGTVLASPLFPVADLNAMNPVHSCLFICNICFEKMEDKMVACANDVCLGGPGREFGFLWVGHECEHFEKLEKVIFSKKH